MLTRHMLSILCRETDIFDNETIYPKLYGKLTNQNTHAMMNFDYVLSQSYSMRHNQ